MVNERGKDMLLTILSFIFFTVLVAVISYIKTKGEESSTQGYFLAGRGLSGFVIASSMVLTSLSAEQLVGVNGDSYASDFSVMAWTVTSIVPLVALAMYFLPKYLKGGFTTVPEFFEERYDSKTRRLMSILFLVGYALVLIPGSLYSGAIAFIKIFDIPSIFNISFTSALWIIIWAIGIIGGIYSIFGGLKAVAISDTLIGIGLFIGGSLIPIFGLIALGKGNFLNGVTTILNKYPEKLNAIGSSTSPTPWITIFTGILIINFFYWSTNQAIVQRVLGAKDLASGQKGILMAGLMLLFLPLMLNLPGTISFGIFGDTLKKSDFAYPLLVSRVLPKPFLGFFLAAFLGAILSTFNGFMNSAITLFCLDVYVPKINPKATDKEILKVAKIIGAVIAIVSMCVAPMLQYGSEGLFLLLRRFAGFFNIPIVALVLIGFINKTVSGKAARLTVYCHIILYYLLIWVFKLKINFANIMGMLFVFDIVLMLILGTKFKRETPYKMNNENKSKVNLSHWNYAVFFSIMLIAALVYIYGLLSPIGIATKNTNNNFLMYSIIYWIIITMISLICNKLFLKSKLGNYEEIKEIDEEIEPII